MVNILFQGLNNYTKDQIIIYQRVLRVPRNEAKEIGLIKCFVYLGIIRA
jgi:hypothetical protein